MKHFNLALLIAAIGVFAGTGCLNLSLGGGSKMQTQSSTTGQQLVDLQKAKDSGAINDAEYNQQRAKILNGK